MMHRSGSIILKNLVQVAIFVSMQLHMKYQMGHKMCEDVIALIEMTTQLFMFDKDFRIHLTFKSTFRVKVPLNRILDGNLLDFKASTIYLNKF